MVREIADMMKDRFDRNTLALQIPEAFDQLKSRDAKFEMVTSNLLQPLTIFYQDKIVKEKIAAIFVTTNCRGSVYKNAMQIGQTAKQLF